MPLTSDDVNLRTMAGASNKPFDYLARGLALLVSDLAEWKALFVDPGTASRATRKTRKASARRCDGL